MDPFNLTIAVVVLGCLTALMLVSETSRWLLFVALLCLVPFRWTRLDISLGSSKLPLFAVMVAVLWIFLAGRILFRDLAVRKRLQVPVSPIFLPLALFLIANLVSLFYAVPRTEALAWNIRWVGMISLSILILWSIKSPLVLRRILFFLIVGYGLIGLYGLYTVLVLQTWRAIVIQGHWGRNALAFILEGLIPLGLCLALSPGTSRNQRKLYGFATASMVLGLIFTYSRGAWLSLAIGLVLLAPRRKQVLAFCGALFLVAFMAAPQTISARLGSFVSFEPNLNPRKMRTLGSSSNLARVHFALSAMKAVQHYPLSGVGTGVFNENFYRFATPVVKDYPPSNVGVQNQYLLTWAELGPLGLLSLLGMIGYLVVAPARAMRLPLSPYWRAVLRGFAITWFIYAFHFLLTPQLYRINFWVMMGLTILAIRFAAQEAETRQPRASLPSGAQEAVEGSPK